MSLSAKEAAELVSISKDGLLKAIKTGKVSAQKDSKGAWRIEPIELFRVYPPTQTSSVDAPQTGAEVSVDSLQAELRQFQQRLADKDDVIADLRARLDAEAEERRKLTMILTDTLNAAPKQSAPQSPVVEAAPQPGKPKGFWQRIFGS